MSTVKQERLDLIGTKYGRLTVIAEVAPAGRSDRRFLCQCDCGTEKIIRMRQLRSGNAKSCGCFNREQRERACLKHGHSRRGQVTKTHHVWANMIQRCVNPKHPVFHNYGGRGITVCDRWLNSFENFLADMGERPTGKRPRGVSLDRIDNNGNYEPGNCRWATQKEQMNNTRINHYLTHNDLTLSLSDWAKRLGVHPETLRYRLRNWPQVDALTKRSRNHKSTAAKRGLHT